MKTENNIPNAKVIAMTIAMVIYGWLNHYAQNTLGMEIPINFATIIGGVIVGFVGWIVPPSEMLGDGIKDE